MARTNVEIDDQLINEAVRVTGARSKREAIDIALRALVARESVQRALRRLRGKAEWEGDLPEWRRGRR